MSTSELDQRPTDERGESPCYCPEGFFGHIYCQESNPAYTYCKWERQCEDRARLERLSESVSEAGAAGVTGHD